MSDQISIFRIQFPLFIKNITLVYIIDISNGMRSSSLHLSQVLSIGLCPEVRSMYTARSLIILVSMTTFMFLITFCNFLMVLSCVVLESLMKWWCHFIIIAELSPYKFIEIGWSHAYGKAEEQTPASLLGGRTHSFTMSVVQGGAFKRRHPEYKSQGIHLEGLITV